MKEYVKMFIYHNFDSVMDLVSEVFIEKSEAEHFSECFRHNYYCVTYVGRTMSDDGYIVFADKVATRLIRANISLKTNEGLFANWNYSSR